MDQKKYEEKIERVFLFLSILVLALGINRNAFCITIATADITIDGYFADWEGVRDS